MITQAPRLPGIRFEAQPPTPVTVLPRMDIAVLVGFAASGPLHTPVAIEDVAHFRDIFGDDLPLAWDEQRGETVTAYLAAAVRAFFRNGGQRCWVVRVAGAARTSYFPIPGLLQLRRNQSLAPAYARARAPGSWCDGLQVVSEVLSRPVQVLALTLEPLRARLQLNAPGDLQAGDLLRLTFRQAGQTYQLMFTAATVSRERSNDTRATLIAVSGADPRWFRLPGLPQSSMSGVARLYGLPSPPNHAPGLRAVSIPTDVLWQPGQPVPLDLDLRPEQAPALGSFVRADFNGERLWLTVLSTATVNRGLLAGETVRITGSGLWEAPDAPAKLGGASPPETLIDSLRYAERLALSLAVQQAGGKGQTPRQSRELGFAPDHPAFWGALPTDEQLFADSTQFGQPARNHSYGDLWQASSEPRFALAGRRDVHHRQQFVTFPLPVPLGTGLFLDAIRPAGTTLERDGLAQFASDLFLDADLAETGVDALLAQADFLRYQQPAPRALHGIHAALGIEEATLVAVPDAVHLGWRRGEHSPSSPQVTEPPAPDLECIPPLPVEASGQFTDCYALAAPHLHPITPPALDAAYRVDWDAPPGVVYEYLLEEASRSDFGDAVVLYRGPATSVDLPPHGSGVYYYRVRAAALANREFSPWSNGVGVEVGAVRPWVTRPAAQFVPADLLRVQQALLTLCAARSDLFAVLALPVHYREDDALAHVRQLEGAFGADGARTLSFGALYHPWLFTREEAGAGALALYPPDGALTGLIARSALARGAWLVPANVLLRSVLALEPALATTRRLALQEGSLNIIRQEPRGFMPLCANTLSRDEDLRLINVRRLLILLRRLALHEGTAYVFEPNSDAFRRQVQRTFTNLLGDLFTRGAFRGATPASAYRVDVSNELNMPSSVEQGRLIVELRVAPAHPLSFLTVRLVQSGERTFQIEER